MFLKVQRDLHSVLIIVVSCFFFPSLLFHLPSYHGTRVQRMKRERRCLWFLKKLVNLVLILLVILCLFAFSPFHCLHYSHWVPSGSIAACISEAIPPIMNQMGWGIVKGSAEIIALCELEVEQPWCFSAINQKVQATENIVPCDLICQGDII